MESAVLTTHKTDIEDRIMNNSVKYLGKGIKMEKAMNTESSERYTSTTACGQTLVIEVFGDVGEVHKMTLGNRFFIAVKCYPQNCENHDLVTWFFDFYNNFAPLLDWEELKKGWLCYQKAKKQRCDNYRNAFWNYFDGKRIRFIGRKKAVFQWV